MTEQLPVVHAVPAPDADRLPCCGRDQWDVSLLEPTAGWPPKVTCHG